MEENNGRSAGKPSTVFAPIAAPATTSAASSTVHSLKLLSTTRNTLRNGRIRRGVSQPLCARIRKNTLRCLFFASGRSSLRPATCFGPAAGEAGENNTAPPGVLAVSTGGTVDPEARSCGPETRRNRLRCADRRAHWDGKPEVERFSPAAGLSSDAGRPFRGRSGSW